MSTIVYPCVANCLSKGSIGGALVLHPATDRCFATPADAAATVSRGAERPRPWSQNPRVVDHDQVTAGAEGQPNDANLGDFLLVDATRRRVLCSAWHSHAHEGFHCRTEAMPRASGPRGAKSSSTSPPSGRNRLKYWRFTRKRRRYSTNIAA